jgi:hypothetical protein
MNDVEFGKLMAIDARQLIFEATASQRAAAGRSALQRLSLERPVV